MAVSLKRALMEILTDRPDDPPLEWRDVRSLSRPRTCARTGGRDDAELVEWLRVSTMTTSHPVGTCKMGNDMAVLDARLKVRSVDRLRAADASAVPIISSRNTNAPAIMIGEKCAEFILEEAA